MSNNKKFNNGPSRFTTNVDAPWAETQQNSPQSRKQPKFQAKNGPNKYYKNYNNYNKHVHTDALIDHRDLQNSDNNACVPNKINKSYNQSVDPTLNDCNLVLEDPSNNSPAYSPSTDSTTSDITNQNDEHDGIKTEQPHNVYDQGLPVFAPCSGHMVDVPQSDLNAGCYNTGYEYEYQQSAIQQQSQYYIYQPYQDYSNVGQVPNIAGSPLNTSFIGTPQQQYYTAYQPMPSYIYDPQNGSYASAYSPVQPTQNFQRTPGTNLSSPQQQSTFLASYQTPPQQAHQLYIQTSNITPPTSLSPNDTPSTNSSATANTDRASNCNSPHPTQNGLVPSHITQTPVHNPYLMYNPDMSKGVPQYTISPQTNNLYTPVTPQQYNSPIPTQQFMMYNPPPMSQGSPFQTGPNSPMMHTPYSNSNTSAPKYSKNRNNRYTNGGYQNKRNFNQKYNYAEQTPQPTYEENYMNSPVSSTLSAPTFEKNLEFVDQTSPEAQMPMYPTSSYCDPNMGMPNTEAILNAAYNYDGIESYGEDYGDCYDDITNGDDNDENLACQVCRGRRMCFCYFLKVRYYKFPSFFDLVDHQYKKWRKTMASNNMMQQQQLMNGQQNMMNQSQSMNSSMMQQSPNMNSSMMQQQQMSPSMNTSMSSIPKKA